MSLRWSRPPLVDSPVPVPLTTYSPSPLEGGFLFEAGRPLEAVGEEGAQ